jgi:hypothetical protein
LLVLQGEDLLNGIRRLNFDVSVEIAIDLPQYEQTDTSAVTKEPLGCGMPVINPRTATKAESVWLQF